MEKITDSVINVGVFDNKIDLFEGVYKVPNGIKYNSYLIIDEKTAVFDSVDGSFTREWLDNIDSILKGKEIDYLFVQHMEPDHSASIEGFLNRYKNAKIVTNAKAVVILKEYFDFDVDEKTIIVENNQEFSLGKHNLTFIFAPMVHWPEVMLTYDKYEKILFSADAFGTFGNNGKVGEWDEEARRYYIGIVGKYGMQVQNLLKIAKNLDISVICSLHGPVLKENLQYYIDKYDLWSSYGVEEKGTLVAFTSVYAHTKKAVEYIVNQLKKAGEKVTCYDLARTDCSYVVADSFKYGKILLATTTYNAEIFPAMNEFITHLVDRNFQNRFIGIIENGSWAPCAGKKIVEKFAKCKNIAFAQNIVTIRGGMKQNNKEQLQSLANEIISAKI